MGIFLTGNQQFGRKGAINTYNRPFDSVAEMDQHLIEQWNKTVTKDDIIFVLGNFTWDPETAEIIIGQLHGTIFILAGEWDKAIQDIHETSNIDINYINSGIELISETNICLSYWPLVEWPGKKQGYTSIIGYPVEEYRSSHRLNRLNVACDFWDYKPVDAERILTLFEELS